MIEELIMAGVVCLLSSIIICVTKSKSNFVLLYFVCAEILFVAGIILITYGAW